MKKTVLFMVSFVLAAFLMTACSSTSIDNQKGSKLFRECFVGMIDKIDKMNYESCCAFLTNKDYDYKKTAPSVDTTGNIIIVDEENPGFELSIYFCENKASEETIDLITYSDGNYEVSATDNFHFGQVTYNIHNPHSTPANNKVSTVEDLASFVFDDVPQLKLEYNNKTKVNENIDVQISVQFNKDNSFLITTNLPDNTCLLITLSGNGYTGQEKLTIKNGKANSSVFTNKGKPLSGKYNLEVTMPLPSVQSEDVKDIIGLNGEFLTGKYVVDSSTGNSKIVEAFFIAEF